MSSRSVSLSGRKSKRGARLNVLKSQTSGSEVPDGGRTTGWKADAQTATDRRREGQLSSGTRPRPERGRGQAPRRAPRPRPRPETAGGTPGRVGANTASQLPRRRAGRGRARAVGGSRRSPPGAGASSPSPPPVEAAPDGRRARRLLGPPGRASGG